MNLKKPLKLICTLSINFVEFCLKFENNHFNFSCIFLFFFLSKIILFCFQLPAVQLCSKVGWI